MRKLLLGLGLAAAATTTLAADYSDNIHKNDYSWKQFNLMYASKELPGKNSHDYMEMEFGGRSGIVDLYGYIDVFNLTNSTSSDKYGKDKIFLKIAPRFSLDAITGKDLSFGPVKELYIATLFSMDGGTGKFATNNNFIGLGSDIDIPWLGKTGVNLYALYDSTDHRQDWNGYQLSANWFKPLMTFDNDSFIAYQGYFDYQFGMKTDKGYATSSTGFDNFNGIYWHSKRYAVGYGLKYFNNVYGIKNSDALKSTGFGQYIDVSYKF
ncbi:Nucleoside-specific channel-forming protein tsx precursor [Marinomonas spartinae]|uniref:Nucleoside-specific channel-forming protein tsx n=1 Tax=Marinomonas spartinae TaxID=1792290 RepID=A0A1A8TAW2_9GAMM|nr:outer membrane protein OmpK [Marinomonas spartinae]SBS29739.1 Nucleoside-specific channel-forming protein tsx precursor [Marinomonas spartinae]SBS37284.1 Nucleoside-specific channel-forming protein tsx precursor [Marinomonas spartinae]